MELSHRHAGKAVAMEFVCAQIGLEACRDACAFGDGENDVEMLRAAHRSIAPSNTPSERVRAAASVVRAETNDDVNVVAAELNSWQPPAGAAAPSTVLPASGNSGGKQPAGPLNSVQPVKRPKV